MRKGDLDVDLSTEMIAVIIFLGLAILLLTNTINSANPIFGSCNTLTNIISNAQGATLC